MHQSLIRYVLIISCCLFTPLCTALSAHYQIELLIFSHITKNTLSQEQWISAEKPIGSFSSQPNFVSVSPKHFILNNAWNRLAKLPGYRLLYHAAWIAPSNQLLNKTHQLAIAGGNNQYAELSGNMSIRLQHYFDIGLQLYLTEPTNLLKKIADILTFRQWNQTYFQFTLNQNFRMRSRELNYISHPLFGALIKIIPVQ